MSHLFMFDILQTTDAYVILRKYIKVKSDTNQYDTPAQAEFQRM
jgi:hypothetical protein